MNRHMARNWAAAGMLAAAGLAGCQQHRALVDPCWPQRYSAEARKTVVDGFAPQVQNGHVLDQTVWNYMFNTGTDELNGYGKYKLDYMVRRRPQPDANVYLQTAHDLPLNLQDPAMVGDARRDLDQKRVAAVQNYLNGQMAGRPMAFNIAIHDPYPVSANAAYAAGTLRLANTASATGVLGSASGGGNSGDGSGQQGQQGSGQQGGGSGSGSSGSGQQNTGGGSGSSGGSRP